MASGIYNTCPFPVKSALSTLYTCIHSKSPKSLLEGHTKEEKTKRSKEAKKYKSRKIGKRPSRRFSAHP
jgi:hypothetical protein